MPQTNTTKQWEPDAFGQNLIDQMIEYTLVAERCGEHLLRSYDSSLVKKLWPEMQADFDSNPDKYPAALPARNDMEGRNRFQEKCKAVCFPNEPPRTPKDYIMMIFGAHRRLELLTQELYNYPYETEVRNRANLRVLRELGGQEAYDAAIKHNQVKPMDFLDDVFKYRDNALGKELEYTVIDVIKSAHRGEFLVLQDQHGQEKQVTLEEFNTMRVSSHEN